MQVSINPGPQSRLSPISRLRRQTLELREERFERFSYYNKYVEIHDSARGHGVADQDIVHAINHALATEDAGEDPDRWLIIGARRRSEPARGGRDDHR